MVSRLFVVCALVAIAMPLLTSFYGGGWIARYYSPPYSTEDIPNLSGKTAIVTGANTGIGYVTARELARKGAKVIVAARSEERGQDAVARIKKELKGEPLVEFLKLDLASFAQISQFVRSFRAKASNLDILVLNAAVIMNDYTETEDGFESQIGVNHLGHFLLVRLLLPMIRYSKTRIVHVSSKSHDQSYPEGIRFESFKGGKALYSRFFAYGQSKLANVLFSNELAIRLNGTGATSNALHPGIIATEGQRHVKGLMQSTIVTRAILFVIESLWNAAVLSIDDGALTTLFVATSPSMATTTGRYYIPIALDRTSETAAQARNETLQKELWAVSEKYIAGW